VSRIRIRKLRKGDAGDLGRIDAAITKTRSTLDFKRIVDEEVKRSGDASFVAEHENQVVGYMISYISSGNFGIDKSAWIAMFGVDPKFMGQGIGRSLAEKIFKVYKGKGITHVFTSVSWDSTDLLSFFKTLGFDRSDFINHRKILD